jgi:putative metallohydrolase (TIGR04338 family)
LNPRDRQRFVYESEEAALSDAGRTFRHLGEVRTYLSELVASDWWADRWPQIEAIPVGRSRSGQMSGYAVDGTTEIRLASLREPVVLHEIAHVVTPGAGHGPAFVDALLALVRERLGFHSYGALLAEFRHRDVVGEVRRG